MYVPRMMFLTKGVGRHKEKLVSLELALRRAGIAPFNLIKVSSIYPPGCKIISRREALRILKPGQVVHTVMSETYTKEPHRLISASIGIAIPKDRSQYGYLSEHHAFGETEHVAGEYAEDLAAWMLATILGVDFDPDLNYDEKKEIWRISDKIIRTRNITQSAIGHKAGLWTTCLAAAVLIP
jgi:arginine decarboxylase